MDQQVFKWLVSPVNLQYMLMELLPEVVHPQTRCGQIRVTSTQMIGHRLARRGRWCWRLPWWTNIQIFVRIVMRAVTAEQNNKHARYNTSTANVTQQNYHYRTTENYICVLSYNEYMIPTSLHIVLKWVQLQAWSLYKRTWLWTEHCRPNLHVYQQILIYMSTIYRNLIFKKLLIHVQIKDDKILINIYKLHPHIDGPNQATCHTACPVSKSRIYMCSYTYRPYRSTGISSHQTTTC